MSGLTKLRRLGFAELHRRSIVRPDPVDSIERSHLVALRQRWVVEYTLNEIIDAHAAGHYCLADVNQFRRACADCMDSQQSAAFLVEDQLEHAQRVGDQLSAGDFAIAG